eukprot:6201227-Pleurochrysis_carterae.AAC.2
MTHGVQYMLVQEGVLDQIDWVRLEPGHSYGPQDQIFSTTRSTFYSQHAVGPDCESPLEFEAMLVDKLKTINCGMEMLWQLANFDSATWLKDCMAGSFSHYGFVCANH